MTGDNLAVWFERASRFCAYTLAALGLAVLLGWALDITTLKSVLPGLVTMNEEQQNDQFYSYLPLVP